MKDQDIDKQFDTKTENTLSEYRSYGYSILTNFILERDAQELKSEIEGLVDVPTYFDNKGKLRRIERFYNKGECLKKLHEKISRQLLLIFSEEFKIFKDKYNVKPPSGEGFFPHYDGIFLWDDAEGKTKKGWYEYAPEFINVLIALDECNESNGTIELAPEHDLSFECLLSKTKKNGTPELVPDIEQTLDFEKVKLGTGDAVIFSHKCPHRSAPNHSPNSRGVLYYTYNRAKFGDHYHRYFNDKLSSNVGKNMDKALSS